MGCGLRGSTATLATWNTSAPCDSSRPDDPLVQGYWCFGAYHWRAEASSLSALMLRPYSQNQPDFRSENALFGRWFWTLREATSGRGVWLLDRGGDRPEILADLLRVQPRWIVRLREDRGLIGPGGWRHPAGYWADWALKRRPERGRAVTLPVSLPRDDVPQFGPAPRTPRVFRSCPRTARAFRSICSATCPP